MGPTLPSDQDKLLTKRFQEVADKVASVLKIEHPTRRRDQFVHLQWRDIPLVYEGPRFGVIETPASTTTRGSRWVLQVAEPLQKEPVHILEWTLWREAVLENLVPHVRQVPEAADLGLYAGIKHGTKDSKHKRQLQKLWETVSPPQHYENYRYHPTLGFDMFDNVVDGTFIKRAILWLNGMRTGKHVPITSSAYTAALERWMMETQRILTTAELRVLKALVKDPSQSQEQLAKQLKLTPGTISPLIRRLANKHLLRVSCNLNMPLIGLQYVIVILNLFRDGVHQRLKQKIIRMKYADLMRSIGSSFLMTAFLIPIPRFEDFKTWMNELCQSSNLPPPSYHIVTDLVSSMNFQSYTPDVGWSTDFTSILELAQNIIREGAHKIAPPLRSFRYSYERLKEKQFPLHLRPEDFTYLQRSTQSIEVTDTAASRISKEARQLGLSKPEHKLYRRRVGVLDKLDIQSRPFRIGMLHIHLETALHLYIRSSNETTKLLLRVLQLFPHQFGYILNDGSAITTILLPNLVAIEVFSSLRKTLAECGIDVRIAVQPGWRAYPYIRSPVIPEHYDFEKGEWFWSMDA